MDTHLLAQKIRKLIAFNPSEFLTFASHLESVQLKKDELWESPGKIASHAGFINKGIIRAYQLKDGAEFIHEFYTEGDFFGDYISYQNQLSTAVRLSAIEDCEILRISFRTIEELSDQIPDVKRFSEFIGKRKEKQLYDRAASLLTNTPEERYKELLQERPDLIQRLPQYYLAQYLGVTPISLSRIRKRIFINKR
ncbi:MAG: Crp/Fnr family transcriptional regulator [Saprospiraceae bacterium]|nr:Crp/Fnr family transcriptional regulator [Saprospiraceae bacterium]